MYKINVRHNYLYKLIGELPYLYPEAKYRIKNDSIITSDPQVVEVAKYVFQFQPDLLVIEYLVPGKNRQTDRGEKEQGLWMPSVMELA